jgi:hypothetical protein
MEKHWYDRQITCGLELAITEGRDDEFRYDMDGKALKTMSKNPAGHRVFYFWGFRLMRANGNDNEGKREYIRHPRQREIRKGRVSAAESEATLVGRT